MVSESDGNVRIVEDEPGLSHSAIPEWFDAREAGVSRVWQHIRHPRPTAIEERSTKMTLGPLEYAVIGVQDQHTAATLLPALDALQENGSVRVVDFVFVTKAADGRATVQEVGELSDDDPGASHAPADSLQGLLTAEDVANLAAEIPANASAVIVLLEHAWALDVTDAVSTAGGVLYAGGLVSPAALSQVRTELAAVTGAQ